MKNFYFSTLFAFTFYFGAWGQCPPPGHIYFISQQELDAFAVNYPDCTNLSGKIIIGDETNVLSSDITDLSPLNNIEFSGGLQIHNVDNLTSLAGLENLTTINGDLSLSGNNALTDLNGLSGIDFVVFLSVSYNDALISLNGLNDNFTVLNSVLITGNDSLSDLTGLNSLTNLYGDLLITDNTSLINLEGLNNLTNIGSYLRLNNNDALEDLTALSNLSAVNDYITIIDNDNLVSLEGIGNIDYTTINSYFWIYNNPKLSVCNVESICNYIPSGPNFVAFNNALGCNSEEQITSTCPGECPPEDVIVFTSQQEVNDFAINYPNCTYLSGSMAVGRNDIPSDIHDLSPLNQITAIHEHVAIEHNDSLLLLDDLTGLNTIGGFVRIFANQNLTAINGFGNLVSIGGSLRIYANYDLTDMGGLKGLTSVGDVLLTSNSLTSLNGLDSLKYVEGHLAINGCKRLKDLRGLEQLVSIGDFLSIEPNDSLVTLEGLNNLASVGGTLNISYNSMLSNFNGLESLTSVGNDLRIYSNPVLTDMSGLMSLNLLERYMDIRNNDQLTTLAGLDNIDYNELEFFWINFNPNLSICYVESICNYLANGGFSGVNNNAPGCDSSEEIEASCIALPVELINFTVEAQRGSVLLTWQTASETNNQGFDIQRSKDGINWEKIGYQQGTGNSNTTQNYRRNDTQPLSGINYYRLKQIDLAGDFVYSNVVNVLYESRGFGVFPVPAKDEITLQIESSQTTIGIHISNIIGEIIHTQDLHLSEGVNQITFDISEYTNGVYFLTIDNGDKNGTQRFVKY